MHFFSQPSLKLVSFWPKMGHKMKEIREAPDEKRANRNFHFRRMSRREKCSVCAMRAGENSLFCGGGRTNWDKLVAIILVPQSSVTLFCRLQKRWRPKQFEYTKLWASQSISILEAFETNLWHDGCGFASPLHQDVQLLLWTLFALQFPDLIFWHPGQSKQCSLTAAERTEFLNNSVSGVEENTTLSHCFLWTIKGI